MAIYTLKESKKAPSNSKGFIHWAKENLFSTPANTIMTFIGFYILYLIIPPFLNWAYFDANFAGNTKAACVNDGACWTFVKVKMDMFIYGFYPKNELWRLIAVIVLFVGLVFGTKQMKKPRTVFIAYTLFFIVSFILVAGGLFGLELVPTEKWGGLMLTIFVATIGILFAFPIGIIVAFGRQSKLPIIKSVSVTYVEFIRGVPLITILFMSSVILPLFFPEGITFNKLLRALIGITLFQAAYVAEIIRGGLQAVSSGQYEAADAIGLSYWQKMFLVILPQALKVAIPNLVGAFISLLQDTTLVLIIGLFDLLAMVQTTAADSHWLGMETEGYVFVTFIFWVFCYAMSRFANKLENRFNTNLR